MTTSTSEHSENLGTAKAVPFAFGGMGMRRKAVAVGLALTVGFGAAIRSLVRTSGREEYVAAVLGQSEYRLEVAAGRGCILDCRGEPLVDRETRTVAAVAPTISGTGEVDRRTEGRYRERLRAALEDGKPFLLEVEPAEARALEGLPEVTLFQVPVRTGTGQPAVQLIGQVDGRGQGVSGVELA